MITPFGTKTGLSLRRRLRRLEGAALFQHPPNPDEQIISLALRQITDEDLKLMMIVARDQEAGLRRTLSQRQTAAVEAYGAGLDLTYGAGHRL